MNSNTTYQSWVKNEITLTFFLVRKTHIHNNCEISPGKNVKSHRLLNQQNYITEVIIQHFFNPPQLLPPRFMSPLRHFVFHLLPFLLMLFCNLITLYISLPISIKLVYFHTAWIPCPCSNATCNRCAAVAICSTPVKPFSTQRALLQDMQSLSYCLAVIPQKK